MYRRSSVIRRRRIAVRGGAGATAIALMAGLVFPGLLADHGHGGRGQPRGPLAETTQPTSPRDVPTNSRPPACSCRRSPTPGANDSGPVSVPTGNPQAPSQDVLAFASDRSGNYDIYTIDADGSHLRRLTSGAAPERDPAWSPDAKRIAFVRLASPDDSFGEIVVMTADGSNQRTIGPGGGPRWSPDGSMIAYHVLASGDQVSSVWVMEADGSSKRRIVSSSADPAWTADGTALVFGSIDAGVVNVYRVSVDHPGTPVKLTHDHVFACEPEVSRDGTSMAYVRIAEHDSSAGTQLMRASPDGTSATALTHNGAWEFGPSWDPAGAWIAVERDPDSDPHYFSFLRGNGHGPDPSEIVLVKADGSGEVSLPKTGTYSDGDPSFAPRGP